MWRQYAENVAESLTKGSRVIVTGRLKQRNYETREGEKRTSFEIDVDDVGPALRYATAKVNRVSVAAVDSAQIRAVPHLRRIPGPRAAQPTTSTNPLSN